MFLISYFGRLRVYFLILVISFVSACTTKHTIELNPDIKNLPIPTLDKSPLTIGVYYTPEFINYEFRRKTNSVLLIVPAGKGSVALFDKVLPIMFVNVVQLKSWPISRDENPEISGVLIPSIESLDYNFAEGFFRAEIVYKFTLYSPDGQSIASWKVKGIEIRKLGGLFSTPEPRKDNAFDLVMQDAAAKFVMKFGEIPEVQKWLQRVVK